MHRLLFFALSLKDQLIAAEVYAKAAVCCKKLQYPKNRGLLDTKAYARPVVSSLQKSPYLATTGYWMLGRKLRLLFVKIAVSWNNRLLGAKVYAKAVTLLC
jgi:hypothetical protein